MLGLVSASLDFELGRNISFEELTLIPIRANLQFYFSFTSVPLDAVLLCLNTASCMIAVCAV